MQILLVELFSNFELSFRHMYFNSLCDSVERHQCKREVR